MGFGILTELQRFLPSIVVEVLSVLDYRDAVMGNDVLTIGRVAAQAGVNVETIRYYQRVGLVGEPLRPLGSIRLYGAASVGRLVFIKRAVIRILNRRSPPTVGARGWTELSRNAGPC